MNVVVDTSVWSLALRRHAPPDDPSAVKLRKLLERRESVLLLGVILQELLHGVCSEAGAKEIRTYLEELPLITLQRDDYIAAAVLQNECRAGGVQVATTDAQIAAACLQYDCALLTNDRDFEHIARFCSLHLL